MNRMSQPSLRNVPRAFSQPRTALIRPLRRAHNIRVECQGSGAYARMYGSALLFYLLPRFQVWPRHAGLRVGVQRRGHVSTRQGGLLLSVRIPERLKPFTRYTCAV